jgi:hypothetical protein
MKRAGRTRVGTQGARRASATAAQGIGALDTRDALGVIAAAENFWATRVEYIITWDSHGIGA